MQNPKMTRLATALITLLFVASLIVPSSAKDQTSGLARQDENAIRATIEAYRTAWLKNDAKGVLKTFTDDAVLLPAHGAPAVIGIAAIEKYWFTPGGPPTIITDLNISVDQVSGTPTMAFARGLDGVAWNVTQDGATHRHSHSGTYLNVMRKLPDGSWRIQAHMWDDGSEHVE
jgi:uncharacterized protein (TIGR02246 family)